MLTPYIHSGNSAWGPSGIAFAGNELVAAALPAQILYVMDDNASSLQPLFSSGERARAVLPYQDGIYIHIHQHIAARQRTIRHRRPTPLDQAPHQIERAMKGARVKLRAHDRQPDRYSNRGVVEGKRASRLVFTFSSIVHTDSGRMPFSETR